MIKKEDSRIKKTRRALYYALLDILKEKAFESITINELCDKANVRRATFYKHFRDKTDFLYFIIRMLRYEFDTQVWNRRKKYEFTKEYYTEYSTALINFLWNNRDIANKILSYDSRGAVIGVMIHQNFEDTRVHLEQSINEGMNLTVSSETAASVMTGGVAVAVINWFFDGCKKPKDELISEINLLIKNIIEAK